MGYGPNKYTGAQFIDGILEHLRNQLMKQGEFQNNSLGYFGCEFNYKLEVKLLARGETHLIVPAHGALLATNPDGTTPDDVLGASITATDADTKSTVKIQGGTSAGTATRTQTGDHKQADPDKRLRERQNVKGQGPGKDVEVGTHA